MQTGKIICYWLNGQPIGLTRYGNRWWQATANEPLHPLRESLFKEDSREKIHYLCEAGSTLHVTELARMMGCALEDPDGDIDEELEERLRAVKLQGVTVSEEPREMNLQMQVCEYKDKEGYREFSLFCRERGCVMNDLFYISHFDNVLTAKHWGKVYADFFRKHGMQVNVVFR